MSSTQFKQLSIIILIQIHIPLSTASIGDQSSEFIQCKSSCVRQCHDDDSFNLNPFIWSCRSECKYTCMWTTIALLNRVVQFYGKWPFIRLLGIQEPASTLASVINFLVNLHMLRRFAKEQYKRNPLKYLWFGYSAVCLNAWFWSTIFHTRDTHFTQMMDYISAFSMILYQLYSFFVSFICSFQEKRRKSTLALIAVTASCLFLFVSHANYLSAREFDYGYNMKMNVVLGVSTAVCWLTWLIKRYYVDRLVYSWRGILSVVLFASTFTLEAFDFEPLFYFIDAHALWHFSTIVIPFLWFKFLIDDSYFNESQLIV